MALELAEDLHTGKKNQTGFSTKIHRNQFLAN